MLPVNCKMHVLCPDDFPMFENLKNRFTSALTLETPSTNGKQMVLPRERVTISSIILYFSFLNNNTFCINMFITILRLRDMSAVQVQ